MKKINKFNHELLHIKHEKKRIKRIRVIRNYTGFNSTYNKVQNFQLLMDKKIITAFSSRIYTFLVEKEFITGRETSQTNIIIPESFNLSENYNQTINSIKDIVYSIWKNIGKEIIIDFSNCKDIDQSSLFLLQILRFELMDDFLSLDRKLSILTSIPKFKIIESKHPEVNACLLLCGYISQTNLRKGIRPVDSLGYIKGSKSQKHYLENRKGIIGTKIVRYINQCLIDNKWELSASGKGKLGNMISEILNNAEDHSPLNTYYVTANYYVDYDENENNTESVGVLNLSFLNFGYSIFEGLEENKNENFAMYEVLEDNFTKLGKTSFSKENIYTLFALQDGVSRLKYTDNSRGTGTMTFINCFYSIGDYENSQRAITPKLSILSGNTQLICNNKYKPFKNKNGNYLLTLNRSNNISEPPDKNNLLSLMYKFPGTILSVRFCLNSNHIQRKIEENENN